MKTTAQNLRQFENQRIINLISIQGGNKGDQHDKGKIQGDSREGK